MTESDVCCPEFDPTRFEKQRYLWRDKLFLRDDVRQIFHIPVNMGKVVKRMFKKIEHAKAMPEGKDFLMLSYNSSPWRSEIYMTISKDVPGEKMAKITGEFLSKVYDGPYSAVPKWIKGYGYVCGGKRKDGKKIISTMLIAPNAVRNMAIITR
ncbi:MAG: hypothetical protein A3E37_05715 [Candidatus Andersenbacteria bacterium RIFCSPHIGHO2_12_FULL_46_9]|nr:MAG: hypothetical protein A3B76_00950 [Candidatus Andersenbacteria bacterium RIFCSPHIGHO2_02_FULL_46_16]OGY35313.1 MAG: hypothetical protein A3E37_05715 [Candidatus Andersenbacteria bacterium RIFCSPHIGHO2_12_FULL_46_9]OGY38266.1 MAG: hypothetical protein A3G57_04470 [Candidatus Andersenbacteria bacterium RIFCSPLOWO2_12_FULL_45_8]OGY38418.1 MAG: hypothetical protein A3I08_02595 [Candidatus Andersenbacteria bacterium RIFCSPLOWO2_02_FULL_46_11]HBE90542.1 hypothetical protein [Candidatus Anderse